MFTEEFAILGKIPLKIVRIKSQQTKSNFKWWFGSLSQSFFSSATQIIIRFCTGPNHHYFPSDRLYSLIGVITSQAPLWLGSLSVTPSKKDILRWTIGCHIFFERSQLGLFLYLSKCAVVSFQMSLQIAWIRGCKVTLFAFFRLFATVNFQMCS